MGKVWLSATEHEVALMRRAARNEGLSLARFIAQSVVSRDSSLEQRQSAGKIKNKGTKHLTPKRRAS